MLVSSVKTHRPFIARALLSCVHLRNWDSVESDWIPVRLRSTDKLAIPPLTGFPVLASEIESAVVEKYLNVYRHSQKIPQAMFHCCIVTRRHLMKISVRDHDRFQRRQVIRRAWIPNARVKIF